MMDKLLNEIKWSDNTHRHKLGGARTPNWAQEKREKRRMKADKWMETEVVSLMSQMVLFKKVNVDAFYRFLLCAGVQKKSDTTVLIQQNR